MSLKGYVVFYDCGIIYIFLFMIYKMTSLRRQMRYLNPYDLHKLLINEYVLKKPGDTTVFKRDCSKDRNDYDVIRENHKFLWNENETPDSWEVQFAKKYYDKLFKEYCIGDLSLYKENKIALRWRTEKEVVVGKGQFICGNKRCNENEGLRTWEVNFAYKEQGEKKNALVKIRLCPDCSKKLNFHSKKREIKRLHKKTTSSKVKNKSSNKDDDGSSSSSSSKSLYETQRVEEDATTEKCNTEVSSTKNDESPWETIKVIETKSREEEMEEYLQDLLL